MLKIVSKVAGAAAMMLLSGAALALPLSWSDSAGAFGTKIQAGEVYEYTHDITDGLDGYRPGIDSLTSASLSILLFDDAFFGDLPLIGDGIEKVGFSFDNGTWSASTAVDGNILHWDDFDFIVTSLLGDGLLKVAVRSNTGDFYFGASDLIAEGSRVATVPEPATLAMFGIGLLSLGLSLRRRSR